MALAYTIGVDEVGRGPIAGPLCVGACLVRAHGRRAFLRGVRDSKQLSGGERQRWAERLRRAEALGECRLATSFIGERRIERLGLSAALTLAVCKALRKLGVTPESCRVLLDGCLRAPKAFPFQETVIGGDEREPLIAAASIVAKVRRDRHMTRLAQAFPQYGFEQHKGYGTKKHYEALRKHGLSPVHRKSFLAKFEASRLRRPARARRAGGDFGG